MKTIKAAKKYTLYTLIIVLMTVSVSSAVALVEIHSEAITKANSELKERMLTFRKFLERDGESYSIKNKQMFLGSTLLDDNSAIPDMLTGIFGGTFTIFAGDTRVSTSVRRADGTRIVGTRLVGPAFDAIFGRGESYHGEAKIEGINYITAYETIRDAKGTIIGALYTGVKKDDYLSQYNKLRVGIMGILSFIVIVFSTLYYYLFKQGKRSEQKSARDLAFLQTLIDTIPNPVFYKDACGNYLGCNFAFESLFGLSRYDVIGKTAYDIITKDITLEQEEVDRSLLSAAPGTKYTTETQITAAGGIVRDVVIFKASFQNESGLNEGIIGSIIDITERKNLQKIMIQTEKMLMIGGLATGMAHELNNPLCSILQNTQNIQRRISTELNSNREVAGNIGLDFELLQRYIDQRGINEMLEFISSSSIQAAEIVANILFYCRKGSASPTAVSLHQLVDSAVDLACSDYGIRIKGNTSEIKFIKEYDTNIPSVFMNRSEIEQVLINLIKNAVQALKEGCSSDSARIVLRTRQSDRQVVIEIEDNGPGIPAEIIGRIFEPFFTTKDVGSGTGMGLSVANALVVNNHNGEITVDSLPGRGTKFSVMLPLITDEPSG